MNSAFPPDRTISIPLETCGQTAKLDRMCAIWFLKFHTNIIQEGGGGLKPPLPEKESLLTNIDVSGYPDVVHSLRVLRQLVVVTIALKVEDQDPTMCKQYTSRRHNKWMAKI